MLKVAVLVSGGGTNLQAIIDAAKDGKITNAKISLVISNNRNAYALERAANAGIASMCIELDIPAENQIIENIKALKDVFFVTNIRKLK